MNQLTPESAREALAAADAMTRAGFRRGFWPRWAMIAEAIGLAVTTTAFGLYQQSPDTTHLVGLAVLLLVGLWLRFTALRKFGALAKPTIIDSALLVIFLLSLAGVAILPRDPGPEWLVWVFGPAYAVLRIARYELGRRAPPKGSGA